MKILKYKIQFLSPFFNYYKVNGGIALTSDFIGDIALDYALAYKLGLIKFVRDFSTKPHYGDIKDLPFMFSIGKLTKGTNMYCYRATIFGADMGVLPIDSGSTLTVKYGINSHPKKNIFKTQGFWLDSKGEVMLVINEKFYADNITLFDNEFTLRTGTRKETLIKLIPEKINNNDTSVFNLYSLRNIFTDKINQDFEISNKIVENRVYNYVLLNDISIKEIQTLISI